MLIPKDGPQSLWHRIPPEASRFRSILIGSPPEGLTSENRKDWLSSMALGLMAE